MTVILTNENGEMKKGSISDAITLVESSKGGDPEHGDIGIESEEGLVLSIFRSGWVTLEDPESDTLPPMSLKPTTHQELVDIITAIDRGDGLTDLLSSHSWRRGYWHECTKA